MVPLRSSILFICLLALAPSPPVQSQVQTVGIDSEGLELRGHFYSAQGSDLRATLLLIPGWPGNATDVMDLGATFSEGDINVLVVNPRGIHESEGVNTFRGTLEDIGAAFRWLREPENVARFQIDTMALFLGGHSFGGGMSMAYAATDPKVRRVISIAGTDHGEIVRKMEESDAYATAIREMLLTTQAPHGPVRFDLEAGLRELSEGREVYGLRENAVELSDRSILLIGGWEDRNTTVDDFMLPLYRALRAEDANDVTFLVYHDNHGFGSVRKELGRDIRRWIKGHAPS